MLRPAGPFFKRAEPAAWPVRVESPANAHERASGKPLTMDAAKRCAHPSWLGWTSPPDELIAGGRGVPTACGWGRGPSPCPDQGPRWPGDLGPSPAAPAGRRVEDVASRGLSVAEAARLLEVTGPNELPQRGRISVWSSIGVQLRDPLIMVLLAALVLTVLTGDYSDAAVIALVVVANTSVGVAQEIRADRAITALTQLSAPSVRVIRGGAEVIRARRGAGPRRCDAARRGRHRPGRLPRAGGVVAAGRRVGADRGVGGGRQARPSRRAGGG